MEVTPKLPSPGLRKAPLVIHNRRRDHIQVWGVHLYNNNTVQKDRRQAIDIKSGSRQHSLEFLRAARAELEEHGCMPKLPKVSSGKILLETSSEPEATTGSVTGTAGKD